MIKLEQFKELKEKGLNLDLIYTLQKVSEGKENIGGEVFAPLISTLERKGYILVGKLTEYGVELLKSLETKKIKIKKFPKISDEFDKWWKAYPGTTEFTHRGIKFPGTRAIRIKKESCRIKYEDILNEGYSAADMLAALEKEVLQKKEESFRTGQNKLNYMQNSLTYLNQRTFEPYIETLKEEPIGIVKNSIDI